MRNDSVAKLVARSADFVKGEKALLALNDVMVLSEDENNDLYGRLWDDCVRRVRDELRFHPTDDPLEDRCRGYFALKSFKRRFPHLRVGWDPKAQRFIPWRRDRRGYDYGGGIMDYPQIVEYLNNLYYGRA